MKIGSERAPRRVGPAFIPNHFSEIFFNTEKKSKVIRAI
jgi:hypothetical protein